MQCEMDTPATSTKKSAAGSKPKIDPLQLLKCLSILLNAEGGIRGDTEVPRVKGLMAKYSKKLVSKCIYLNILQATKLTLLDAFYDEGGWELVGTWLQDAVKSSNWPLALQVLSLLETSPMTVSRLKRYGTPRLVKELSRDCVNSDVQSIAKQIVLKWMDVVRLGDGSGTAAGVGLSGNVGASEESPPMIMDTPDSKSDAMAVEESCMLMEKSGSAEAPINIDSSQECGDGSSSMEGQDDSSNASTESDNTHTPRTPIRITIRSGSQVLAKVSSQRVSQDSNDSDDNKPLSVLKKEVQKARLNTPEESEESDANVATSKAPGETSVPPVGESDTKTVDAPTAVRTRSSSVASDINSVSNENSNSSIVDSSKALSESVNATTTTTTTTTAVSTVHTVVTFSGNQGAPTSPSPSEQETVSPTETNGEVDKANEKPADSDSQEQTQGESGDDKEVADGKGDESDSKKEKDQKNNDKGKDKDSDKKDKKDKEREKDKKTKDDKKKERERDSSRSSKSSSSKSRENSSRSESEKSSKERERSKSDKHKSSHSKSSSKDKDRDRDKSRSSSSRDKERKGSSSSKDKSREKDDKHDKKKEQENKDKATLEKVKPLSADGLAKIPRKTTPASFLDALGSGDVDGAEAKKPSVKTYKSRGFRNTGLLEEPTKPPGKKNTPLVTPEKKTIAVPGGQGVKRPSPLDELVASLPEKRLKPSVSSSPLTSDKPGGVKLISPKRPSLSDDGGFMAALTASGSETRKKVTRKRKSSESDSSKTDGKDEDKKEDDKSPTSSPVKVEEKGMLSPTNVKPTFNFYQETLKDDEEEVKKEDDDEEEEEKEEKENMESADTKEEKQGAENGDVEMKEEGGTQDDDDNMDIEESLRDEDIPIAPAVPAPAQEDYEKVEVTFSEPNPESVKGVLVYHRPENRKKKSVKWRTEDDLQQVFIFDLDETERVNVNTIKFNEMMALDKQREKEAMGKNRGLHGSMIGGNIQMMGNNHMMGMGMHHQNGIEYMRWSLLPIMIPSPSTVSPGYKSQERLTQSARESSTMAAFYHPAMLPETPREPDQEMVSRQEPKEIPLNDVTGQDIMYDHRSKLWPEPIFGEPINFGYGGMGGPPSGGNDAGSHWVVGGPPAGGFPGPGGPMYGAPAGFGGPGMGGPGMGGPGMGGPPGNFGGDMGMDVPWGGPGPGPGPPGPGLDYPNPNMMMGGGGQGMMMGPGGGGRPGGGPRGMMPGMGMGGQNFRGRNGPGGGNWGPGPSNYGKPPVCKHFMNGHCRHGKNCRFLHNRH